MRPQHPCCALLRRIHHAADGGKVVATLTTNAQGIAETGLLPWGEYKITETGVPDGYLDAGYPANAWIK